MGGRLCTLEEMEAGCTKASGCSHAHDIVWTSTPCVRGGGRNHSVAERFARAVAEALTAAAAGIADPEFAPVDTAKPGAAAFEPSIEALGGELQVLTGPSTTLALP